MIVQLTRLWMTSVVTGESFGWYTDPNREQTYSVKGEIRTYAGGRQRAVGSVGQSGSWRFTLKELALTDIAQLREWMDAGVTIFARDHRGQSMYGTFFEVGVGENPAVTYNSPLNLYTAGITLQAVDVVEGV